MSTLCSDMKVYVSHNSEIDSISVQILKDLYLKKTKLLNNKPVVVYDNEDEKSEFYLKIINKTDGQLHAYWMKQIFSGKNVPPKKIIPSEIISTLKNNPSAIVYSEIDLDAKVIYEY
ncbi:hypothetical protein [Sulfurimonas sp.]|uniref:hypothetical protein n=1 Tax=Sulfurimonas sp. TaxID=2022749 RepID=UPI002AB24881|nr:hypothetical protein [Sulfurimonas sp.]